MTVSWIDHCLNLAKAHAAKSKDSTQVGCFIAGPNNEPLSLGFNGPPIRVADTEERRQRPEKYLWVAHAEENAVALAARSGHRLEGATAYVTHFPCARCAGTLIQAGIQDIYIDNGVTHMPQHEFEVAASKFHEAGVWARVRHEGQGWKATGKMGEDELQTVLRRAAGGQFKAEEAPAPKGLSEFLPYMTEYLWGVVRTIRDGPRPKFGDADALGTLSKWGFLFIPEGETRYAVTEAGEAALARYDAEQGWIPWTGGACPVGMRASVRLRLRSGYEPETCEAGPHRWGHLGTSKDIVAYRVVEAAP